MSKNIIRLALMSLAVFSLASCSGSEDSGTSTSSTLPDTMVIGMECNYAPFNWTESAATDYTEKISNASGYADGYDVQIAKKLSTLTGMKVEIIKEEWDSLIPDIQTGSINMIIAGMTDTEEREQSIAFTDEYYRSEVVLMATSDIADTYADQTLGSDDLTTLLSGKNVVSQKDTVEDDVIDNFVTAYGCYHAAAAETYGLAAQDVANGTADFLVVEYPVAQAYVASMDGLGIIHLDQDVLGVDLSQLGVSIGINKNDTALKEALNEALAQISQTERDELMTAAVERSSAE